MVDGHYIRKNDSLYIQKSDSAIIGTNFKILKKGRMLDVIFPQKQDSLISVVYLYLNSTTDQEKLVIIQYPHEVSLQQYP